VPREARETLGGRRRDPLIFGGVWIGVRNKDGEFLGNLKIAEKLTGKRVVIWEKEEEGYDEVYEKTAVLMKRLENRGCGMEEIKKVLSFINEEFRVREEHLREKDPT
jgi:hypothetical protein